MLRFFIAFFISALAATGVGGGGLYILYLTLVCGLPQLQAQGINLAFFMISAVSSLLVHAKKRKISLPIVLTLGITGALGALLGARLASVLDTALLSKAFGAFLIFCGIQTLFSSKKKKNT